MTAKSPAQPKKRGNSKPNVKRRGDTYTYYLYVTDHLGRRKQHTKGGYKTQREAEDARFVADRKLREGREADSRRVPHEGLAAVAQAAGLGGVDVGVVRQVHPVARAPADWRGPAPTALAGRSEHPLSSNPIASSREYRSASRRSCTFALMLCAQMVSRASRLPQRYRPNSRPLPAT